MALPPTDTVFEAARQTLLSRDYWPSVPPSAMVPFFGHLLNTRSISMLGYLAEQCLVIVVSKVYGNRWPEQTPKQWAFSWGNYRHKEFLEAYHVVADALKPPPPPELQPLSPELRELAAAQRASGK